MPAIEIAAAGDSMEGQCRHWCIIFGICNLRWQIRQITPTAAQQMPARHKQIGEGAGHEQAMGVLIEAAIAHLDETEHPLDDPDRMLDLGSYFGLVTVFRPLPLVHHATLAVSA